MCASRNGIKVAIIYDGLGHKGVYQEHEYRDAESIFPDVKRIDKILKKRGDRVFLVPMIRSAGSFLKRLTSAGADLVFNLCEEALDNSRHEMNICALLELSGIPYTGCGPLSLGLSLNKALTKRILLSAGIPTPDYFVFDGNSRCSPPKEMRYPLFVKPIEEDASLGIDRKAFIRSERELKERCRYIVRNYRQPALVEEFIDGRELNVSVIGNEKPVVLPISEIDMGSVPDGEPRICSYGAKWVNESSEYENTVPVCPAPLKKGVEKMAKEIALESFRLLECRGYARVDMRLSTRGVAYVLEVNPNPCLTIDSGIVRSAAAAGLSYADFICKIADLALYGD